MCVKMYKSSVSHRDEHCSVSVSFMVTTSVSADCDQIFQHDSALYGSCVFCWVSCSDKSGGV